MDRQPPEQPRTAVYWRLSGALAVLTEWAEGEEGEGCHWCLFSEGHEGGCPVGEARAILEAEAAAPDPVASPLEKAQGEPDAQATDLDDPGLHSQPRPLDAGASPEGRELRLAPDPVASPHSHNPDVCEGCMNVILMATDPPDPVASPPDRDILAAITHEPDFNALVASSKWHAYADYIIEQLGAVASPAKRVPFIRYRLTKGSTTLTFRVPPGTPMILEQSGWRITSEDGELPVASPEALRQLRELLDATDPPNVAWVNTGADLERLVAARDEARRYLAATEEGTP